MGLVSRLLSFVRTKRFDTPISDVKVDIGGRPLKTLEHFSAPGDDSFPLVGDYVAALSQIQTGRMSAVGYHDPINTPVTLAGGKRIYARNESGESISQVWLKNDKNIEVDNGKGFINISPEGTIRLNNDNGFIVLESSGDINLNSVIIKPNGNVIMPNSLVLDGKEIDDHVHSGVQTGSSNTGPNV